MISMNQHQEYWKQLTKVRNFLRIASTYEQGNEISSKVQSFDWLTTGFRILQTVDKNLIRKSAEKAQS